MNTNVIISVPNAWTRPSILDTSTPEENRLILESGCQILTTSRSEAAGINNEAEKIRLKNDAAAKIEDAKKQLTREIDDLKRKLVEQTNASNINAAEMTAQIEVLTAAKMTVQTQIEDARKVARDSSINEVKALREELEKVKKASEEERKQLAEAARVEREQERIERQSIISKTSQDKELLVAEVSKLRDLHSAIQLRKSNSSLKGADNEKSFEVILKETFGTAKDFNLLEKKSNSGDFRLVWEGGILMFEVKAGYTEARLRDKGGIPKSHKDFTSHTECNALIFVSEDTSIPDHSRAGDIDFEWIDGRPVIYIGNFARQLDKVYFINVILIPILRTLLKMSKQDASIDCDVTNKLHQVINEINRAKNLIHERLRLQQNKLAEYARQQQSGLNELKSLCASDAKLIEMMFTNMLTITPVEDTVVIETKTIVPMVTNTLMTKEHLENMVVDQLKGIAKGYGITGLKKMTKPILIDEIIKKNTT